MTIAVQPRKSLRFRGRSFMALVLAPEPPLDEWMAELDGWSQRSPGYFVGRPIILDVAALPVDKAGLATLIDDLGRLDVRVMGVEGTKASLLGPGMPPLINGGRQTVGSDSYDAPPPAGKPAASAAAAAAVVATAIPVPPQDQLASSLLIDSPVRSGQSIIHPEGDVTIMGSVASGSEVVAGGSIHVYGTLRGRAIAGSSGNGRARIFCSKLEAELMAIDGLYRTADEIDQEFRGRPVQAWLQGDAMVMAALS